MSAQAQQQGRARGMVLRGFLAQNVAVGSTFGAFGVSVIPLQAQFGASRGMVSLAVSLAVLTMGLAAPLTAMLIGRTGLRTTMTAGVLLSLLGSVGLAFAPGMSAVLLLYAVPIGLGLAFSGPFPSSVLASNWYPRNPGLALGLTNMPLLVALLPMAGLHIIEAYGLDMLYLALAGLNLLLLPFVLTIRDRPGTPSAPDGGGPQAGGQGAPMIGVAALLRNPRFQAMCIGAGLLNAAGIIGISHMVAFGMERGIAATDAAVLLSVMGGAAVVGSLLAGYLCGRIGPAPTLALIAAVLCAGWLAMATVVQFLPMLLAALLLGIVGAGVFPSVNMLSGRLFGQESLPRVIGLFSLMTLPLTFGLPPLAGVARDQAGSYAPMVAALIGGAAAVALLFLFMARSGRQAAAAPQG